jgi:hypothetical protein
MQLCKETWDVRKRRTNSGPGGGRKLRGEGPIGTVLGDNGGQTPNSGKESTSYKGPEAEWRSAGVALGRGYSTEEAGETSNQVLKAQCSG